uniref:Uncharacterized protein n=1 Tax=Arundo donax TaxID=35708 RepID=A0A0A8ZRK6_ARUDO
MCGNMDGSTARAQGSRSPVIMQSCIIHLPQPASQPPHGLIHRGYQQETGSRAPPHFASSPRRRPR